MALVYGVKFDPSEFPVYYRLPPEMELDTDDFCVVRDPEHGCERIGYITCREGRCACQSERLRAIERPATDDEIVQWHEQLRRRRQAVELAQKKIVEHKLPMKLGAVRFDDDQNLVVFHFTADRRIDFRELVRDLAGVFKARIELWQIGVRQEASHQDGYGVCGQRFCCAAWMTDYPAVSIRHAREQDIHHAPPKLSGMCGRLRCCLRFEYDSYREMTRNAPPVGATVRDREGREGTVIDRNLLRHRLQVQLTDAATEWFAFEDIKVLNAKPKKRITPPTTIEAEDDETIPDDPEQEE